MDQDISENLAKESPRHRQEKESVMTGEFLLAGRGPELTPPEGSTPSKRPRPSQILCEEPSTELVHSWIGPAADQNPYSTPRRFRASGARLLTRTAYSEVRKNMKSERVSRKLFMKELDEAVSEFEQTERLLRSHEYEFQQGLALLNQYGSISASTSPGMGLHSQDANRVLANSAPHRQASMELSAAQSTSGVGLASLGFESTQTELERLVSESRAAFGQIQQVLESLAQMMDGIKTLSKSMNEFSRDAVGERPPGTHEDRSVPESEASRCTASVRERASLVTVSKDNETDRRLVRHRSITLVGLIKFGGILALCSVPLYFVLLWILLEEATYRLL
ncbi:hypothetical protein CCYA_CCYA13G3609 [Cyanidiococcus yangmingshanensis]|nr:hypothetical protein CCYA_CCYA13G3609 [Cyanidiococcus yangmingshanensis]